jgi:cytochrome P450
MGGISWTLVFLAANPGIHQDLREEIKEYAEIKEVERRESWDRYLLSSATFLTASIIESSRLKPLAAFSVPQAIPTDRAIREFLILAGINCIIDSYALNTHNSLWGEDSAIYRPTRFLEQKKSKTKLRCNFWRFGFGPRAYMGKYVADLMMRIIVVYVVRNYEVGLMEGEGSWEKNMET